MRFSITMAKSISDFSVGRSLLALLHGNRRLSRSGLLLGHQIRPGVAAESCSHKLVYRHSSTQSSSPASVIRSLSKAKYLSKRQQDEVFPNRRKQPKLSKATKRAVC